MSLQWMSDEERQRRERELAIAQAYGTHGNTTCPICRGSGKVVRPGGGLLGDFSRATCGTCKGKGKI